MSNLKGSILGFVIGSLLVFGCRDTTTLQFSERIERAKHNKTFVREYICDSLNSFPIKVGEVWVEKAWYNETFGRTVDSGELLYIRYLENNLFTAKDYWNISLKDVEGSSVGIFESHRGHLSLGHNEIWYVLTFKERAKSLPDTLRFNIFDKRKSDTSKIGALVLIAKPE